VRVVLVKGKVGVWPCGVGDGTGKEQGEGVIW